MTTEKILKSYTVAQLRKEIIAKNIKGVTKMKRADLHAVIMKNKERFSHLKEQVKVRKPKTTIRTEKKNLPQYESNLMKAKRLAEAKAKAKKVDKVKLTKPQAPPKNLPLGAKMNIKESIFRKQDTEKRKIKTSDIKYFTSKVRELLKRKLGNQAYLNSRAFETFINLVIKKEVQAVKADRVGDMVFLGNRVSQRFGLSRAALLLAKILASKKYGKGDWEDNFEEYKKKNPDVLATGLTYTFKQTKQKEPLIKLIVGYGEMLHDWFPFIAHERWVKKFGLGALQYKTPKFFGQESSRYTGMDRLMMIHRQYIPPQGKNSPERIDHKEKITTVARRPGAGQGDGNNIGEYVLKKFSLNQLNKIGEERKYFRNILEENDYYLSVADLMRNIAFDVLNPK